MRVGIVLLVAAQLFALGAVWMWAVHGLSPQAGTACLVSWFAATVAGIVAMVVDI